MQYYEKKSRDAKHGRPSPLYLLPLRLPYRLIHWKIEFSFLLVMAVNWLDFPQDLLVRISEFCTTPDHIRMQYVCKSWGSILKKSIPLELPWLMMLPNEKEEEEDPDVRVFYSLSKKKIHTIPLPDMRGKRCCGSFQNGWLMTVDDNLDISLFHPWSKRRINLPHQSTFKDQNYEGCSMEVNRDMHIRKVALSDDGSLAMFVYGLGDLAFCKIGDDDAYTDVVGFYRAGDLDVFGLPLMMGEQIEHLVMEDVIYHKGYFYAVSKGGSLYRILFEDRFHATAERLTPKLDHLIPYTLHAYLVPDILTDRMFVITEDVDAIFRVENGIYRDDLDDNSPQKTTHFDIFAVPFEEEGAHSGTLKTFTKVESLGDRVLFLGYNSSMIVMASQFPGLKGNRIYFADNMLERYYDNPYGCPNSRIFSLEDGTVEQLFADRFHPILSPPLWIATPPYSHH